MNSYLHTTLYGQLTWKIFKCHILHHIWDICCHLILMPYITSNWLLQAVLHTTPCRFTCYSYRFIPYVVCWKQTDTNTWLPGQIMVQCYMQWNASIFKSKYYVQTVTISLYKRLLVIWCILHNTFVKNIMPEKQFEKITQYLHCSDRRSEPPKGTLNFDRLYKIREFITLFSKTFQQYQSPSKYCAIDEAMVRSM